MKLNYKRTFMVGLAFFLICVFWQAYDTLVAITLVNKFGLNQTWSGVILALDNILALFMLPLFGSLSDRAKGNMFQRYGKRTPFIVIGTVLAVICFFSLSVIDARRRAAIEVFHVPKLDYAPLSGLFRVRPASDFWDDKQRHVKKKRRGEAD